LRSACEPVPKHLIIIFLGIFLHLSATAQRKTVLLPNQSCITLDSLMVVPSSIRVFSSQNEWHGGFHYEVFNQVFTRDSLLADTLFIEYRIFPSALPYQFKSYEPNEVVRDRFNPTLRPAATERDVTDNIQKTGSISRGISIGNQQNLGVQSSLNLQLNGRIANRFQLVASISDNNIPLQTAGSTQQFQDFDQIYIQLSDENQRIVAGDFTMPTRSHYFMKYTKRGLGLYYHYTDASHTNTVEDVEVSASISKGRFQRQLIQGIEGNQGPYRLTGANGETYITVLGGTESVYIDGRKLTRGQDQDYVIDYNSSEIIFTPKNRITKDKRIVVEFQYSDRQYVRPLLTGSITFRHGEISKTYIEFFSESDAKNQPLQQALTTSDRATLAAAGNAFGGAWVEGADSTGFLTSRVMYAKTDSLGYDSVFVFSSNESIAKYTVVFTFVGNGNGDYVENGFSPYGKVYKWVAPLNGQHQGNYTPKRKLTAPRAQRMLVIGNTGKRLEGNRELNWNLEGAFSQLDANTFSSVGNNTTQGAALKVAVGQAFGVVENKKNWEWNFTSEYLSSYFNRIERFREVEFERNWNILQLVHTGAAEQLSALQLKKTFAKQKFIDASVAHYALANTYTGYKSRVKADVRMAEKIGMQFDGSTLNTTGQVSSQFIRHKANLFRTGERMVIGFKDEQEFNDFGASTASYSFFDGEAYVRSADTTTTAFKTFVKQRNDSRYVANQFQPIATAVHVGTEFRRYMNGGAYFGVTASNRQLKVLSDAAGLTPANTWLGRLEWRTQQRKVVTLNVFYETASGLEAKKAFIYAEVPAGQGVYVWNDYNDNGIKELDEFEVAAFTYEANYIRLPVQTTDYQNVFTTTLTSSLAVNPKNRKTFIQKFSGQIMAKAESKSTQSDYAHLSPFFNDIAFLLSRGEVVRSSIFFRKSDPKFSADYTYQQLGNKSFLLAGYEGRNEMGHIFNLRKALNDATQLSVQLQAGIRKAASDFMLTRNFLYHYSSVQPQYLIQPDPKKRLSVYAQLENKKGNAGDAAFQARNYSCGAETQWELDNAQWFKAELKLAYISLQGDAAGPVLYDALNGLQEGKNATLALGWRKTLSNNLQLSVNYNGRKSETKPMVHAGNMSVRLLFN